MALAGNEMETNSSRIWTRLANSFSNDNNSYTKLTFNIRNVWAF